LFEVEISDKESIATKEPPLIFPSSGAGNQGGVSESPFSV